MNKEQFKLRALKSYESGRWKSAFKFLWLIVPIVLISLCTCGSAVIPIGVGLTLAFVVVLLKWRGEEYGASVGPGIWAGIAAFSIPLILHIFELCCHGNLEILVCGLSGAFGGALLGSHLAQTKRSHRFRLLLFSVLIAGLTAGLGCASLGVGASVGLFASLLVFSVAIFILKKNQTLPNK